jgi:hypothetical protein
LGFTIAFAKACQALFSETNRELRFIFWNLLHEQGVTPETAEWGNLSLSDHLSQNEACFYFRNVQAKESVPVGAQPRDPLFL